MGNELQKYREVAVAVASVASDVERAALLQWAQGLLAIRDSQASTWLKSKRAVQLTVQAEVVWPLVKMLARELKRVGWDERGTKARGFLLGGGLGVIAFGSQGAGIAALGTAIGVPLWVVLGAGGTVIATLIEEITKRSPTDKRALHEKASHSVIDAERKSK